MVCKWSTSLGQRIISVFSSSWEFLKLTIFSAWKMIGSTLALRRGCERGLNAWEAAELCCHSGTEALKS